MKKELFFLFLLMIISLGFLLPVIGQFAFLWGSNYSDLVISHFPNLVYIQKALVNWKQIPLWSDTILSGYPFSANPLSGMFYFPTWIAVILPEPLGVNLLILIHLLIGGAGIFAFLRSQKIDFYPSILGVLIFVLMPKIHAHYAAGHITLIFAVSWTPWLLYSEIKRRKSFQRIWKFMPGLILGTIFMADPRWVVYAGGLWIGFSLYLFYKDRGAFNQKHQLNFLGQLKEILFQFIIALLVAAPLLLPLLQFSKLSTRSLMTQADHLIFSLPPSHLLGLFIPDMAGYAEWVIYPGALAGVLFVWVIFNNDLRKRNAFWLFVLLGSIFVSLGESIPGFSLLTQLPGISLLRVPSRGMFLAGISFAVLSADALQGLMEETAQPEVAGLRVGRMALIAFMSGLLALTAGIWWLGKSLPLEFLWGAVGFSVFTILLMIVFRLKISKKVWITTFIVLTCLDLGLVDYSQMEFRNAAEVVNEQSQILAFMDFGQGPFRIYSPSYSVPQQMAVINNLQLADGVDPMQLLNYAAFMEKATGVPDHGYSVTLPPFENGNPQTDNQFYLPSSRLLGLLNVKYVVSEFEIEDQGFSAIGQTGQTFIYINQDYLPRGWVASQGLGMQNQIKPVKDVEMTSNWIRADVEGPGEFILSEIDYPGWYGYVDGAPVEIQTFYNLFRGVQLDKGMHQVYFEYKPLVLYLGIIAALVVVLIIAAQI